MTWPQLDLPWPTNAAVEGPRRWWNGPLDVEGLAVGAVRSAVTAANVLAVQRGSRWHGTVDSALVGASFNSIALLRRDGAPVPAWAELSGFFETADGWVRLHGNYPHHAAVIRSYTGADDKAGVQAALRSRTALDVERDVRAAGGIAGAVRSRDVWRAHPQYREAVEDRGLVTLDAPIGSPRQLTTLADEAPMTGIRVLDLTRVIAGPTATRLLAALGADVLRLDPPPTPELLDQHLDTDFGKRTALVDLSQTSVAGLLDTADVVITGYRPGALDRFGLSADELLARRPWLVSVDLSAWGATGPWAHQRGFDSIVQAVTGIGTTYADHGRPGALPVQALDHATGYLMAAAAMRLLAARETEGGRAAHLSLARTGAWLQDHPTDPGQPVNVTEDRFFSECDCGYGRLRYVRPPVVVDGELIDYPAPPDDYGTADLSWNEPPAHP
ncbi:CoA transferase [Branchiibius sp. NY16-3462-2]|uniref:CoA transferase n=1 Tax=Branchiibius sp. NY16-3462-2 TaxID=1807500 RepID=UPI0007984AD6|nr:CoA transferase [Branchiibius sp. NY16-3462-2]KYH43164.1 hypothetical protein AZH51_12440 [Branchiibius sp. NY16-3462-2]